MTKRKRKLKEKLRQRKDDNLIAIILIVVIVSCIGIMTGSRINFIKEKNKIYKARQIAISKQLEEQRERKEELEAKAIHIKTDEYKIEVAKEKLGLVFPDEIVIKAEE